MARKAQPRTIHCYICGRASEVSSKAMSTTCPGCHKAIKVEDLVVKTYVPVNDLATCGQIKITRRGRVAAKHVKSGAGVVVEGSVEGSIMTGGDIALGPKSVWRGPTLEGRTLKVSDGATLEGYVKINPEGVD